MSTVVEPYWRNLDELNHKVFDWYDRAGPTDHDLDKLTPYLWTGFIPDKENLKDGKPKTACGHLLWRGFDFTPTNRWKNIEVKVGGVDFYTSFDEVNKKLRDGLRQLFRLAADQGEF